MTIPEQKKQRIMSLLDTLSEERLEEVADFVEFLYAKHAARQNQYTPVTLGGLWADVMIDDTDIAAIRKELWGVLEDRTP